MQVFAEDPAITHGERIELYKDLQPLVGHLIRKYGGDPDLREELPGEIYWRFTQLVEAYDPGRGIPIKPYLVRSLTAFVYSYARSRQRQRIRESSLNPTAVLDDCAQADAASGDPGHLWDDQLVMRELLKSLRRAIARLPLRQRQVVIWRYYEERSFEQIAEALEIEPVTARSLLRHGVNHLRRWISGSEAEKERAGRPAVRGQRDAGLCA